MVELDQTMASITHLFQSSEIEKNLFPHVLQAITALKTKLDQGSTDREDRMQTALKNIVENELNVLDFIKAKESLVGLLESAKGLVVKSILPEIKKYIEISENHQNLIVSIEEAIAVAENDKVIEARKMIEGLRSAIAQYKGIIITPMRDHLVDIGGKIQAQIETEITQIRDNLPRIISAIEEKQARSIYEEMLEFRDKAEYLGAEDICTEIDDLTKLCHLQFDPSEFASKKKNKKKSKVKPRDVQTTFVQKEEDTASAQVYESTTLRFTMPTFEEDEVIPAFDTPGERREFKRKLVRQKRARIHRLPQPKKNLNNSARSSLVRQQLQLYSSQINRPVKRADRNKCQSCGALQKTHEERFCSFCGKTI
jgi:hypothetical protein